jgi:anti-anti-sigma factor
MSLEISVGLSAGHAMAAVRGELDIVSSPDAISAIASVTMRRRVVIVELSELEFIDCSALGALLTLQRRARQSGRDVLLAAPVASPEAGASRGSGPVGHTCMGAPALSRSSGVTTNRPLEASADCLTLARYPAVPARTLLLYADA